MVRAINYAVTPIYTTWKPSRGLAKWTITFFQETFALEVPQSRKLKISIFKPPKDVRSGFFMPLILPSRRDNGAHTNPVLCCSWRPNYHCAPRRGKMKLSQAPYITTLMWGREGFFQLLVLPLAEKMSASTNSVVLTLAEEDKCLHGLCRFTPNRGRRVPSCTLLFYH